MSGPDQNEPGGRAANVFLSYARSDEAAAARLVHALEQSGLEVWWDARIEGGAEFARSIEAALDRCDAVVVIWSAASVQSDWVLDEASRARRQRKLVPVSLDGTPAPLGFGQYQSIKLTGWSGHPRTPEVEALVRGVTAVASHALHEAADPTAQALRPPSSPPKLRWPLAAGGVAAAAGVAVALGFALRHDDPPLQPGDGPVAAEAANLPAVLDNSIAVLRFTNVDGSEQTQVFSDGLADDVISALSRVPGLFVSSRGDSFTLEPNAGSRRVRDRLRVAYYLEGSVQVHDEAMRVIVQLVDSASGFQLLSRKFDRPMQDYFAIRDEITRLTVSSVRVALPQDETPFLDTDENAPPLDAYVAYRRGKEHYEQPHTSVDELAEVIDDYQQALDIDPQFAAAHAGLCDAYVARFEISNAASDIALAEKACAAALGTSPRLYRVHTSLGDLYRRTGRPGEAERAYREALQVNPNDVRAMAGLSTVFSERRQQPAAEKLLQQAIATQPGNWRTLNGYGAFLFAQGRYRDAADAFRQAVALDPENYQARGNVGASLTMAGDFAAAKAVYEESLKIREDAVAYSNLGVLYYYLWDFPKSVASHRKALALRPSYFQGWVNLADSLHFADQEAEARRTFEQAAGMAEDRLAVGAADPGILFAYAWVLQVLGRHEEAEEALHKGRALASDDPYGWYYTGLVQLDSGEKGEAIAAFRKAVENGYPPRMLAAEPYVGDLRTDPAFEATLAASSP